MKGDRTNYGKKDEGVRVTLRLYGNARDTVEMYAYMKSISKADAVVKLLDFIYATGIPK